MAELRVKGTGTIKLFENDNTSSVTIASPASLGGDRTITLPDASVTLASGTMNDATNLSGTVPIANGGTGSTSTTYASLTANVSGTLPVGNGGTGATTLAGAGLANTPSFFANQATTQSISNGSVTKVTLGAEIWDTDSAFASDKFTVPVGGAGKYAFQFGAYLVNTTTNGYLQVTLYKNGAALTGRSGTSRVFMTTALTQDQPFASSTVTTLADSDYIEFYVYQNNQDGGGGARTLGDANHLAYLGGWKLIGV